MKKTILIIAGSLTWILTMFKSGLNYPFGLGFWGANGHDGIWHIALANSLARGDFSMPTFSGTNLQNYHIGFDLLLAAIHKVTFIPIINLYFQILPIIISLLVGILSYNFVFNLKKSKTAALWSTFFVYFGGSFGWLIGKGESAFWSQQAVSTLINPPFALSLIFLLLGLICLQKKKLLFATFCFGLLLEIKAYGGILALGGLLVISIFKFAKLHEVNYFKVFLGSLILSLILFLPFNQNSTSLLVWQPFWFLETQMSYSDRVGWQKFYEAMIAYKTSNPIKFILSYGFAFLVFWLGNLGTRIIKEVEVIRWLKNPKLVGEVELFLAAVITAGLVIPLFFLQKGTPWNTIQFLYYSLFFSSLLAGIATNNILLKIKKKRDTSWVKFKILFSIVVILLTIPTTLITLHDVYLPARPPAELPNAELEALNFLKYQPQGVVLTYPFDKAKADQAVTNPPRPLYLYESSAYVAAFSDKSVFLEDQVNLDIMGYDWPDRLNKVKAFYASLDESFVYNFLRENKISYVYWLKGQRATKGEDQLGIEKIFENSEVNIYRVK